MRVVSASFVKSGTKPSHYPDFDFNEVAFAGRSNVGKSSLINTLLGRKDLVRVSKRPGATQLINFFTVRFDDNTQMGVVDLPGYGFAKVPERIRVAWGAMIDRYLSGRSGLKAVVVVMDIRRGVRDEDMQLIEALQHFGIAPVLVFTKADKLSRNKQFSTRQSIAHELGWKPKDLLIFSSHTGQGRDDLWNVLRLLTRQGGLEQLLDADESPVHDQDDDPPPPSNGDEGQP
ncbi:MAG: ribosome biogenesis GTP-binding protein YihA/YsxC [Myxococcota bacterium]